MSQKEFEKNKQVLSYLTNSKSYVFETFNIYAKEVKSSNRKATEYLSKRIPYLGAGIQLTNVSNADNPSRETTKILSSVPVGLAGAEAGAAITSGLLIGTTVATGVTVSAVVAAPIIAVGALIAGAFSVEISDTIFDATVSQDWTLEQAQDAVVDYTTEQARSIRDNSTEFFNDTVIPNFEEFKQSIADDLNEFNDLIRETGQEVYDYTTDILDLTLEQVKEVFDQSINDLDNFIDTAQDKTSDIWDGFSDWVDETFNDSILDLDDSPPTPSPDNPNPDNPRPDNPTPDNPNPDNPNPGSPGGDGNGDGNGNGGGGNGNWFPWFPRLGKNFFGSISPITIDLDGDGTEVRELIASPVLFDLDNDKFAQKTAWLLPDDAFLVRDRNDNGFIDNGNELFGNYTENPDGDYDKTGFEALAHYDDNGDDVIDSDDAISAELQVWQDLNQNGISEASELQSLKEAGITSIGSSPIDVEIFPLDPEEFEDRLIYSHRIYEETQATLDDGSTVNVHDVWLRELPAISQYIPPDDFELNSETAPLPDLQGYGFIPDLRYALSLDSDLLEQATELTATVSEGDLVTFLRDFEPFLLNWAGISFDFSESNQNYADSPHQVAFLEKFFTQNYEDIWFPSRAQAYNSIKESMALRFLAQTDFEPLTRLDYDNQTDQLSLDISRDEFIQETYDLYEQSNSFSLVDFGLVMRLHKQEFPEAEADFLDDIGNVLEENDLADATIDSLTNLIGSERTSVGADGDHTLDGYFDLPDFKGSSYYEDVLLPGADNYVVGGGSGDSIIWNPDDGDIRVYEGTNLGTDVIFFDADPDDLTLSKSGNYDLAANIGGSELIVEGHLWKPEVERFTFNDGTSWNVDAINQAYTDQTGEVI